MKNTYEQKPLYRFLNVIVLLLYIFITLCSIGTVFLSYSSRQVASAKVQCKDGTSWDATKIYYSNYKLCGICTKRSADNKTYQDCDFSSADYSSYKIDKKYAWSWWIILAPLLVLLIGFAIVDFISLAIIYIFSGEVKFLKSALINILIYLVTRKE